MKETWKPIEGYEGLYEISNLGNIYCTKRKITRFLQISKNGYLRVSLSKEGHKTTYLVHRLVAEAFIPNPDNLPQVNHKDENKINNHVDNLEWCTAIYNLNYGNRNSKSGKSVVQYDLQGKFLKKWQTISSAGKELGILVTNICDCCKGGRKTAGGFKWKYANRNH